MPQEKASPSREDRRKIVLLVGNESSLSGDEFAMLGEAGYLVAREPSLENASRALVSSEAAPDIVLLDADLMRGAGTVSTLRGMLGTRDVPFLLLSSGACNDLVALAEEEGVYGVVAAGAGAPILSASISAAFRLFEARRKLGETEERLGLALEGSGAGSWDWMVETGELTVNERWAEMLGYTKDELAPGHSAFESLLHPEDAPRSEEITRMYEAGEIQSHEIELRMRHKDGRWIWVLDRGKATKRGSDGRLLRMSGMHFDITRRKDAEEELRSLLAQREGLMRELQHRVKNSLALASSLLKLELDELSEERSKKVIRDSVSRINSMAGVYERLYRSSDLQSVDLRPYFEDLAQSVFDAYSSGRTGPSLSVESAELRIDAERACTLGLILNELLTNALKYAYPDGSGGPVRVSLERDGDAARLVVSDDGHGFPRDYDPLMAQSLGLTLVRMLSDQIGAAFIVNGKRGVTASVSFRP
jgi:PAS domain S-box-containing protein